jgi:hypothetical protein
MVEIERWANTGWWSWGRVILFCCDLFLSYFGLQGDHRDAS